MHVRRDLHKEVSMAAFLHVLWVIVKVILIIIGVLFVIYFLNLDQKLMGWAYKLVNKVFDKKKTDIKF